MGHLFTIALILFAGSCHASSRIVSGLPVRMEDHPSVVQVEFQGISSGTWTQNCGGTILNNIFILSAANCFSGVLFNPTLRRVRAGAVNRNSGGVVVPVEQVFNHPDFGQATRFDSDITVVRVAFLVFTPTVNQASLPQQDSVVADNLPVVKLGWGRIEQDGPFSPVLLAANVFTSNREYCRELYSYLPVPGELTHNMICTSNYYMGSEDACEGDAGGPVMLDQIVIGVISWGYECGIFPGVSTLVPNFTNWILETTTGSM